MRSEVKAKFFRGFGDPSRARILEALRDRPRCVSDLVKATRLSQPNLSMHLACLRDCGLVRSRRNGRFIYYELADRSVAHLLQVADQVLTRITKLIEVCPRYEVPAQKHGRHRLQDKLRRVRTA